MMPRTCSICSHPERAQIEAAYVAGISLRDIAGQFSVARSAVHRHVSEHIAQAIQQSQIAKEEAQSLDVVKQLKAINSTSLAILKEARDAKENMLALFAVDRVMKQLELQSKLLGNINDAPQINIWLAPEWKTIQVTLMQTLSPYPDARIAVAGALAMLGADHASLN